MPPQACCRETDNSRQRRLSRWPPKPRGFRESAEACSFLSRSLRRGFAGELVIDRADPFEGHLEFSATPRHRHGLLIRAELAGIDVAEVRIGIGDLGGAFAHQEGGAAKIIAPGLVMGGFSEAS